jgi:hypothetical protein
LLSTKIASGEAINSASIYSIIRLIAERLGSSIEIFAASIHKLAALREALIIEQEIRNYIIESENRVYTAEADEREFSIEADNRDYLVDSDIREIFDDVILRLTDGSYI